MVSGQRLMLQSGDALFIPNGDGHVLLSDDQATVVNVSRLPSEPVCGSVAASKRLRRREKRQRHYLQRLYGL